MSGEDPTNVDPTPSAPTAFGDSGSTPPATPPPADSGDDGATDGDAGKDARVVEQRPDWLDTRFKTPRDLQHAYKELETKFSQTRPQKAPDEYEVKLPDGLTLTDDMVKAFKDQKMSNEQVQSVVDVLHSQAVTPMRELQADLLRSQIMLKTGIQEDSDLDEFLGSLETWAVEKYGRDEAYRRASSVEGILEMRKLRDIDAGSTTVPGSGSGGVSSPASSVEARLKEIRSDPDYGSGTARGTALMEEAVKLTKQLRG